MVNSLNRRERKKLNSKKAIIEAAVTLFIQKGYSETSIAEIMNEADLGLGTFYNYFQSKEDILEFFLAEITSKINQEYLKLAQEPKNASEILTEVFLLTGRILSEHRFVLPLFLSAGHKGAGNKMPAAPHSRLTFRSIFLTIIRKGQRSGEFRQDIPAEIVTEMFHAIFQTASFSSLPMPFMENVEYKLKMVLAGIVVQSS
ncbi:hypothetical protein P22_0909 [Propionispora sp. 2/2-37]|uniref:TetR/AcrR family transcriptional regulator n=1 Tax=Propionispora sp. 2/2-37 TaxID=1677858 RepID=UPI0006BB82C9|nr:TetR/AcrR family transcriptional regulator [Propionispora sp. 2/2-37]CUH94843.1 hypothetical protein P22_0909 [Propionispora sp. 2/2-37]